MAKDIPWTQNILDNIFNGEAPMLEWIREKSMNWDGDWVTGTFCVFGPTRDANHVLTVEAYNREGGYFFSQWGTERQDDVKMQILSALGNNGTREEQVEWRRRNGGFDIVLEGSRFVIDQSQGLFDVDVDGWNDGGTIDITLR